jgi:hypothetical protein
MESAPAPAVSLEQTSNIGEDAQAYTLPRGHAAAFLTERGYPVKKATLAAYATTGRGPSFRRFGKAVLYSPAELLAWADGRCSKPVCSTRELVA